MHRADRNDEPLCLICQKPDEGLSRYFYLSQEVPVCLSCAKKFIVHKKSYRIHKTNYHILYEYDEWSERLLFQYKEQKDIVLSQVFLYLEQEWILKKQKRFTWIGLCSSEKKRAERGFEPLLEIFKAYSIFVYSPFYKIDDRKQSQMNKENRKQIKQTLKQKEGYWFPDRHRILVDDVITTGHSMEAALDLIPANDVFILFAHPIWIEEHKKNRRRTSTFFDC